MVLKTSKLENWMRMIKNLNLKNLKAMDHCSLLQLKPHEKIYKMRLTKEIEGNANRILGGYLIYVSTTATAATMGSKNEQWTFQNKAESANG